MADARLIRQGLEPRLRGDLLTDSVGRDLYSRAACLYRCEPRAVVRAAAAEDVAATVDFASRNGLSVTGRGAGSSVAGGAVGRGLVLDLSALDDVRLEGEEVVVGPGLTPRALNDFLASRDRFFPVDPSSGSWCTLGGMVMTNAAGPHSRGYGAMRAWVSGLEAVDADGRRHVFGKGERAESPRADELRRLLSKGRAEFGSERPRAPKCSSGYWLWGGSDDDDPVLPLLCGSEGTLLLVTALRLRTLPRPGARRTAVLHPADLEAAVAALEALEDAPLAALEMLDDNCVRLLREKGSRSGELLPPREGGFLLWMDVDGEGPAAADRVLDRALADAGVPGRKLEGGEPEALAELRRIVSTLLKKVEGGGRRPARFVEDGCVPPGRLGAYLRGLRQLLQDAGLGEAYTFGHAGQGHLHCNPSLDMARPRDRALLEELVRAHSELVAGLDGVPSGEHGDGRMRARDLERRFPRSWPWMCRIKALFDPRGVLNPEVKVPPPGGTLPPPGEGLDPDMTALRMDSLEDRARLLRRVEAA